MPPGVPPVNDDDDGAPPMAASGLPVYRSIHDGYGCWRPGGRALLLAVAGRGPLPANLSFNNAEKSEFERIRRSYSDTSVSWGDVPNEACRDPALL